MAPVRDDGGPASARPSYRAYTVIKREGQDDFWLPIGAAFPHQDGDGYNIVLQALPIDGRVVLRVPKDDDAQRAQQPTDRTNVSRLRRK
jgi:hypothetical protein